MFSHGQKKVKRTEEEIIKQRQINEETEKVCKRFLEVRQTYKTSDKSLDELLTYSSGILEIMSDQSTVINFRQELITEKFNQFKLALKKSFTAENPKKEIMLVLEEIKEFIKKELKFNGKLVMNDLKSYQLWFHRLWLLKSFALMENSFKGKLDMLKKVFKKKIDGDNDDGNSEDGVKGDGEDGDDDGESISSKIVTKDLQMCEMFLNKDERNFHTWNYRFNLWQVMRDLNPDKEKEMIEQEINFIDKIHMKNYSNYSAIHFKIKFYEMKLKLDPSCFSNKFFNQEMTKINQGLFISPNEQALYIFQRWIIKQILPPRLLSAEQDPFSKQITLIFNQSIASTTIKSILKLQDEKSKPLKYSIIPEKTQSIHRIEFSNEKLENFKILIMNCDQIGQCIEAFKGNFKEMIGGCKDVEKLFEEYLDFFEEIDCSSLEVLQYKLLNEQDLFYMLKVRLRFFASRDELVKNIKDNLSDFLEVVQDYQDEIEQNKFLEEFVFNIKEYLSSVMILTDKLLHELITIYSI